MEIHSSARKHGVDDDSIRHAVDHLLVTKALDEDPPRTLVIGPDTAGNMLEVIVIEFDELVLAIHAMPLRRQYFSLLPEGETNA